MPDTTPTAPAAMHLAIALGSSFLGFPTHHGFLREFITSGWRPASISGCSAGAIVAGFYAAGISLETMESTFTRTDIAGRFHEWLTPLRGLGTILGLPGMPAVFIADKLRDLIVEIVGDRRIEDCTTSRLAIAVTNLRTSRVEMRTTGPLAETIMASCALPGVIAPRRIEGELLWDGGLGSSVPVDPWVEDPAITHLAAHSILHTAQVRARERTHRFNFPTAMLAGHQITADELLLWKLKLARQLGKTAATVETLTDRPRIGIPITLPPKKPWPDYSRDLMDAGAASARRLIAELAATV